MIAITLALMSDIFKNLKVSACKEKNYRPINKTYMNLIYQHCKAQMLGISHYA
jgi:hypothetical protein